MTRSTLVRSVLCGLAALVALAPTARVDAVSASGASSEVRCTILGTDGPDRIVGTPGDDVICARGGDDVVHGRGGSDIIYGGRGDDRLHGGRGDDRLYGLRGNDRLHGGRGDDRLNGGRGDDDLYGGRGDDRLNGRWGNDRLHGGRGDDLLNGRWGTGVSDTLHCGGGGTNVARPEPRDVVSPTCEQVRQRPSAPAASAPGPATPAPATPVVPSRANVVPTADAKTLGGVIAGGSAVLTLSGSDADGDALTFHVSRPAHGTVDTTAPTARCSGTTPSTCTATVVYTPAVDFSGSDSFSYRVHDGAVDSAPATVLVTVDPAPNHAPVAAAKNITGVPEDGSRSIELAGSDVDGDALTFTVTQPAHGTLTTLTPGASCGTGTPSSCTATIDYTPDADYHGADSFTYAVSDGTAASTAATVTIAVTPVNDAPVAADGQVSGPQDTDIVVRLDTLVSDVETSDPDLTYTIVSGPSHGTLSGSGALRTYTPTAGYSGADSLTYSVTDRGDPDNCTIGTSDCDSVKTSSIRTVSISVFPAGCLTDDARSDFEAGVADGCDASTVPGSVQLGAILPVVDQSNDTVGNTGVGITTTTWGGQTFTPGQTGALTRLDVRLFCSGCTGTTPDLMVSIRATSGGLPTGADLATATISGFDSGMDETHTATFATPYSVTAGTQYAFVLRPTANPSPGTYALTRSGSSTAGADVYASGTRVAGATSGAVWSIPLTGGISTDAGFQVHIQTGTGFQASGTFTSSLKDAAPAAGQRAEWSALTFDADTPAGTTVRFQVAASSSSTGPFEYVGPDGTADTYFTTSGASLSRFDGLRYLRYRAFLSTADSAVTPSLRSVTICYVNTPATAE